MCISIIIISNTHNIVKNTHNHNSSSNSGTNSSISISKIVTPAAFQEAEVAVVLVTTGTDIIVMNTYIQIQIIYVRQSLTRSMLSCMPSHGENAPPS